jgi:hypothetical protein
MNNDINSRIQAIMQLKQNGLTPQSAMQMLMQRNPNYQIAMQRLNNMSQGRDMKDFVMQLARQNGVSQENLQAIQSLFGSNN